MQKIETQWRTKELNINSQGVCIKICVWISGYSIRINEEKKNRWEKKYRRKGRICVKRGITAPLHVFAPSSFSRIHLLFYLPLSVIKASTPSPSSSFHFAVHRRIHSLLFSDNPKSFSTFPRSNKLQPWQDLLFEYPAYAIANSFHSTYNPSCPTVGWLDSFVDFSPGLFPQVVQRRGTIGKKGRAVVLNWFIED